MADEASIDAAITAKGGEVRELKSSGAGKDEIMVKVGELQALKAQYKEVTGKDHGPPPSSKKKKKSKGGDKAAAPAPAPAKKAAPKKAAAPKKEAAPKKAAAPPAAPAASGGKSIKTTTNNAGPLDSRFALQSTGKFAVIAVAGAAAAGAGAGGAGAAAAGEVKGQPKSLKKDHLREIEIKWQKKWMDAKVFESDPKDNKGKEKAK